MDKKEESPLEWAGMMLSLRDKGVFKVVVGYSGSGDNGDIDDIDFKDMQDKWMITPVGFEEMDDTIRNKVSTILDDNSVDDWYNNDGGGGSMEISTEDGSYVINHYVNVIEREESSFEGNLQDHMGD